MSSSDVNLVHQPLVPVIGSDCTLVSPLAFYVTSPLAQRPCWVGWYTLQEFIFCFPYFNHAFMFSLWVCECVPISFIGRMLHIIYRQNVVELPKKSKHPPFFFFSLNIHSYSNPFGQRPVLSYRLSLFYTSWKCKNGWVIPTYCRERRGTSVVFCLFVVNNYSSLRLVWVHHIKMLHFDQPQEGREMYCFMPCVNACLWNVLFAVAAVEFVIFETPLFTHRVQLLC